MVIVWIHSNIHLAVDGSNLASHIRVARWLDCEKVSIFSCDVMDPKVKKHRKLKFVRHARQ